MIYARIENGLVVELFTPPTGVPIEACFHEGLTWVDVTSVSGIAPHWIASQAQDDSWSFSSPPAPAAPSPARQALAALMAGVQIVSNGTPALNGTYSCDEAAQHRMMATVIYIMVNNNFPGGLTSYGWLDISGAPHVFGGVEGFREFATKIADYVAKLDQVAAGIGTDLPTQPVTIT